MGNECHRVLVPSMTKMQDDITLVQAYVYEHAELDYELLKSGQASNTEVGFAYKLFSAELANSNSAQSFKEAVHTALLKMRFTTDVKSARLYTRSHLDDAQVKAWLGCMVDGGAFLSVKSINRQRATVRLDYRSARGNTTDHQLTLTVAGGTVNGGTAVTKTLAPNDSESFIVERGVGQDKVNVTADVGGFPDEVELDFAYPEPVKPSLLDTVLEIARRAPDAVTPYLPWKPHTIQVLALGSTYRWLASGYEYMNVSVTKYGIVFDISNDSTFHAVGSPGFDGFVITGFKHDIGGVQVLNNTPLTVAIKHSNREVRMGLQGNASAGRSIILTIDFAEPRPLDGA